MGTKLPVVNSVVTIDVCSVVATSVVTSVNFYN